MPRLVHGASPKIRALQGRIPDFVPEVESPESKETIYNQLLQTSILLYRHARGESLETLASEYHVDEGKLEGGLKSNVLWILHAIARICDSRNCYKLDFLKVKILELIDELNLGTTLGKLMAIEGIGKGTVRKLLGSGVDSLEALRTKSIDALVDLRIDRRKAGMLLSFARRAAR